MAEKRLRRLNIRGAYCYGIKLVVKLIGHFGYDFGEWRELLEFLCYYTAHKDHNDMNVWREKLGYCSPTEILEPIVLDNHKGFEHYIPCDHCGKQRWVFGEYGADHTFCMNFKSCEYVTDHYRYKRQTFRFPGQQIYSEGKYKEYYDLFMKTDINLLRMIQETLMIAHGDAAYDYFDGNHVPIVFDMIYEFEKLGLTAPDCEDIPDKGFGEVKPGEVCFDCSHLIDKHFKENIHG